MDVIVLPSIKEAAGMAILEAMALAKPVVATASGGIPEIVVDKVTGLLVPVKNPKRLAQAIFKILRDPKKAKKMGRAARKRVEKLFNIKKSARRYKKVYLEVLGQKNRR